MIKLGKAEDNKQFISITVLDGTPATEVYHELVWQYPLIASTIHGLDSEQILVEMVDGVDYGFSLSDLQNTMTEICQAEIQSFVCEWSANRLWKLLRHQVGG